MFIPILILYGIVFAGLFATIFVNSKFYKNFVYKWYHENVKFIIPFYLKHLIGIAFTFIVSILICDLCRNSQNETISKSIFALFSSAFAAWCYGKISVIGPKADIDSRWNNKRGGKHYALHRFIISSPEKFCDWMKNYRENMLIQNPNANLKTFDSIVGFNSESVINAWDADEFLKIYKDEEVIDLLNLYNIADDIKKGEGGFDERAVNVAKRNFGLEIYQLEGYTFEGDGNGNEINIEYYYKFRKKTPLNN